MCCGNTCGSCHCERHRGTRVVVGKCALLLPGLQNAEASIAGPSIDEVVSEDVETNQGVAVTVKSIAQVKIRSLMPAGSPRKYDEAAIQRAATNFLGDSDRNINKTIRQNLEGSQRAIVGSLTIEQLYFDRESFLTKVREEAIEDLESMGIQIVSYTIIAISDRDGYMDALGQTQLAKVKREAKEGAAKPDARLRELPRQSTSPRGEVTCATG